MSEESAVLREPRTSEPMIASAESCALCGLPILKRQTCEGESGFCCPGCRQVFRALSAATGALPDDFKKTDLYVACMKAGVIPSASEDTGVESTSSDRPSSVPSLDLSFHLEDMWCPACAWLVEEVLRRKEGIIEPRVSFLADTVRLKYLPHMISPAEITSTVGALGYHVGPPDGEKGGGAAQKRLLLRLGISAVLTMNAMMLSWTIYLGLFRDLGPGAIAFLSIPLLLITAPVVFYGGMPILRNAWIGMRVGKTSMDTLISVSILSAFLYSLIQMARGSVHLYFDTAAMLVTIVLLGRYLELQARRRIFDGIGVERVGPVKTRLQLQGRDRWVPADALVPGDLFVVRSGERIALDGRIVGGQAMVDQSVLTGEPKAVAKGPDDEVLAGLLVTEGELTVRASRVLRESSLNRILDLVLDALESRGSNESLADAVSRFFVPSLIAATAGTACLLWFLGLSLEEILFRSLTMLLISCPCAIGIAVPLVKVAIIGLARNKGILVRNPEALERIPHIDVMVLDKTGTVTEGRFTVHHVISVDADERELFARLAGLEEASAHVIGHEIVRHSAALGLRRAEATEIQEFEGRGVTGLVAGKRMFIGNRLLIKQIGADLPASLENQAAPWEQNGMTVVFFGWDGKATGFLVLGDPVKQEARPFVSWLESRKITPFLFSGDAVRTTGAVARSLSIAGFAGQMLPSEKAEAVQKLRAGGSRVAMVGDGVNDLSGLASADVAIALGAGFDSVRETADIALASHRIDKIEELFAIAALSAKTTRNSLVFAFVYNALAIPLAATGFLNPLIAVFAMCASSLTVIGIALRITRRGARLLVSQQTGADSGEVEGRPGITHVIRNVRRKSKAA